MEKAIMERLNRLRLDRVKDFIDNWESKESIKARQKITERVKETTKINWKRERLVFD